jgi:hypothetical protein
MNRTEILHQLIQKSEARYKQLDSQENLIKFIARTFKEYYEAYYHYLPRVILQSYWNETKTELRERFEIPNEYQEFLWLSKNDNILLHDVALYSWSTMLLQTISEMGVYHEEKVTEPIYWLWIATRGDKGNIFLCCETLSPFFGKVVEFYDGNPWWGSLPQLDDDDVYGTFEEFVKYVMDRDKN